MTAPRHNGPSILWSILAGLCIAAVILLGVMSAPLPAETTTVGTADKPCGCILDDDD